MRQQGRISVEVDETDAALTNFPGLAPLANFGEGLELFEDVEALMSPKERDRGYSNSEALFDLMGLGLSGADRIDDLERARRDEGRKRLLERSPLAPSTAHDFLRRHRYDGLEALGGVNHRLLRRVASRAGVTTATLDCDASLFSSTGRDARMSYKGEPGYMPMLAFWAELGVALYDDFRNGNVAPGAEALHFLKQALAQLPPEVSQVFVRADAAWFIAALLDYCHERGIGFSVSARMDEAVREAIQAVPAHAWRRLEQAGQGEAEEDDPEEVAETVHTLNDSRHAYRLIIIRKKTRGQLELHDGPYTYHAIITNMDLPAGEHAAWHRQRGQAENQIGELKWDFATRVLPSGDFFVNALFLKIMILAFNLFAAFKRLVLPKPWRPLRLKSVLHRLLGLPALVVRHARRRWLKLPRDHPNLALFRQALG